MIVPSGSAVTAVLRCSTLVSGTVTTVAAVLLGLDRYDRERVHGASFPTVEVRGLAAIQLACGVLDPEPVTSVIPRARSLHRCGAGRLTVSDSDILDGIAWSVA